jgi:ATP-dependent exoDNAse (exonuclease V) beta subunit
MSSSGKRLPTVDDLTPEQRAVALSWGKSLAVMAGAGSGKTTTLVVKCQELLKKNPEARFAAVSFTEKSASDLRAKLSERLPLRGEGGALSGHWVMTIHGLCNAILRDYPREAGFDGEESMLSEPEAQLLWEQAIQGLWFDELPPETRQAVDQMLVRESRDSLHALLKRSRELASFGAMDYLFKSEDPDSKALAQVASYVLDRYERLKRRRGALDFNDLERGADRALEHESIRQAYHQRFALVMVDEFQDTNPLQASIIRRFCKPDGSNLCVVGDPKQSIYRFRDADVSVFEEFCSKSSERHSLTWNFRSRPGIIEYANAVCAPAFLSSQMAYEALAPKREPHESLQPVVRLDVTQPSDLGKWIRNEIEKGIPLQDMALLLRKIRGNEKWLKALTATGIPIAVGSGGLFWEDARVREMTAFLKWWDNPGNSLSGAVFMRSPWVATPDVTLDEWLRNDPTLVGPFFESQHPIAKSLAPLRSKVCRPGELLLSLLVDEKTEDELGAPLLGLWHRVEELSSRGLDFHSVVTELGHALEESRRERDVPPPRNKGQLSVLTMHASKGLEFPHVILVDLGPKGRSPDAPLLFWDRERGAYLGVRDSDGDRDKDHPVESQWRLREKEKALAESKRVFYVALTRAQERLVLVCPELPERKSAAPDDPFSQDDWRAWVENAPIAAESVAVPSLEVLKGAKVTADSEPVSRSLQRLGRQAILRRPRHSVTEWTLLSRCPRAYEWSFIRPVPVADGVQQVDLFSGAKVDRTAEREITQQELGSRVHSCLERGDHEGLKRLETEVGVQRFQAEPLISWALSSEWMAPPQGQREVWSELEFEIPIGDEILVGSLDRVVLEPGRASIVDFKVTEKPKSVEALVEAYVNQLELYAYALKRLLSEDEIKKTQIEALLVNISPKSIQAVPVSVGALPVESLALDAAEIVSGRKGEPRPGPLCRHCEFRSQCPEARV